MSRLIVDARSLDDRPLTGVGRYTSNLLQSLSSENRQKMYLFIGRRQSVDNLPPDLQIIRNPYSSKFTILMALCNIPLLRRFFLSDDVILLPNIDFFPIGEAFNVNVVIHDLSWMHNRKFFSLKGRFWHNQKYIYDLLRKAKRIICVSGSTLSELVKYYPLIEVGKCRVLYPGVEVTSEGGTAITNPKDTIVFIGTNESRKNVASVVAMWSELHQDLDGYQLIIAGKRGWGAISANLPRLQILDYITDEKRHELYQRAALFIWPSFYEGFGFPLTEAAHYNIPIITSFTTSMPEIMRLRAYYCNPWNYGELTAVVRQLIHKQSSVPVQVDWPIWPKVSKEIVQILGL